jgi:hypothetical protein
VLLHISIIIIAVKNPRTHAPSQRHAGFAIVQREDVCACCVHHAFYNLTFTDPEAAGDRFGKFAETGTHFLDGLSELWPWVLEP